MRAACPLEPIAAQQAIHGLSFRSRESDLKRWDTCFSASCGAVHAQLAKSTIYAIRQLYRILTPLLLLLIPFGRGVA